MKQNIEQVYDFLLENENCFIKNLAIKNEYYLHTFLFEKVSSYLKTKNEKNNTTLDQTLEEIINEFYKKELSLDKLQNITLNIRNNFTLLALQSTLSKENIKLLHLLQDKFFKKLIKLYNYKTMIQNKIIEKKINIIEEHLLLTTTDKNGIITSVTDAFCKLMEYDKSEVIGNTHRIFKDESVPSDFFKNMWQTILRGKEWEGNLKTKTKTGKSTIVKTRIIPLKDENNNILQFLAIRDDITEIEESKYDLLTNLYNRKQFDKRFEKLVEDSKNFNKKLNLIIIDADNFKYVNDTYGHKKGDEVLVEIAKIIEKNTRQTDLCARWGGEEFVIVLPNCSIDVASKIANRIRKSISTQNLFNYKKQQTCSFGLTSLQKNDTACSMFGRADQALYKAKNDGKNRIEVL